MALPLVEQNATLLAAHRLPSSRPLDQRWDRSRGITFSDFKRRPVQDYTWGPSNGIVFAPSAPPSRGYASRPLARPSPSQHSPEPHIQEPFVSGDDFKISHTTFEELRSERNRLEESIQSLRHEHRLQAKHHDEALKAAKDVEDSLQDRNLTLSKELELQKSLLAKAQSHLELTTKEANQLALSLKEETAASARLARENTEHQEAFSKLKEDSAPARYQNEIVLEEVHRNAREATESIWSLRVAELSSEAKRLSLELSSALEREETSQRERKGLESELHGSRKSLDSERKSTAALQSQLDGRRNRAEKYLVDYSAYRSTFVELRNAIFSLTGSIALSRDVVAKEQKMWQAAAAHFEQGQIHPWFRHRYGPLRQSVLDFLNGHASRTSTQLKTMDQSLESCLDEMSQFQDCSHRSRTLTRYHHMRTSWPMHVTLDLAEDLRTLQPLLHHVRRESREIARLRASQDSKNSPAMQTQVAQQDNDLRLVQRVVQLAHAANDIMGLRALLDDELSEKKMYQLTFEAYERVREANRLSRVSLHSPDSTRHDRREYLEDERLTLRASEEAQSIIRREYYLAKQLGQTGSDEQEVEKLIQKHLVAAEERLRHYLHIYMVAPRSGRQSLRRTGTSPPSTAADTNVTKDALENAPFKSGPSDSNPVRRNAPRKVSRPNNRRAKRTYSSNSDSAIVERVQTGKSSSSASMQSSSSTSGALNIKATQSLRASQNFGLEENADALTQTTSLHVVSIKRGKLPLSQECDSTRSLSFCTQLPTSPGDASSDDIGEKNIKPVFKAMQHTGPPTNSNTGLIDSSIEAALSAEVSSDTKPEPPDDVQNDMADHQLTYQISAIDLNGVATSSPEDSRTYWSHKLYKNFEGSTPRIFYCTSYQTTEQQAQLFLNEKIVGFDLEWEPSSKAYTGSIKSCVSLIQIAAEDKIGLFHIARFAGESAEELLPPSLRALLQSPDVIKAGVNISGDATRMRRWLHVDMQGLFELSHLYRVVRYSVNEPRNVNFKLVSLSEQVEKVLLLPLKKDSVRVSHWAHRLDGPQYDYAAADAYAGFRLFHKLDEERKTMQPMPPRPAFVELNQPLVLGDGTEIVKSQKRLAAHKKRSAQDPGEDGEDEEFFDALEHLETDDPAVSDDTRDSKPYTSFSTTSSEQDSSTPRQPELPHQEEQSHGDRGRSKGHTGPKLQHAASPEVLKADAWVSSWRSSLPVEYNLQAGHRTLRAYHLWHCQNLDLSQVASHCRDPPLAITTVASYVMHAIQQENLPYDAERVREPLRALPSSVHGAYRRIIDQING